MDNKPVTESRQRKGLSTDRLESLIGTTGKLTPQAIEFEEAVLGAIMLDDSALSSILDFMSPKMFYVEANKSIYEAIIKLYMLSQPVDLLTVTNQLRKDKLLDVVGGASYLASLTARVTSSANIEYHSRIVMEKFVLRELIRNCSSIIRDSYDESQDVLELLDKAETRIFDIIENNFKRDSRPLDIVVKSALAELDTIRKNSDVLQGVPSGIRAIDDKTGGWQKSDLIILAARPGMGKTSFVLSIARNAALEYGKPVAFFSLEMSAHQLVHRLFSIESGVPAERIAKGSLGEDEWIKLMTSISKLETSNLIIDDTPALSVFDLRAKCRRLKSKYDIKMVIVDYLQLMQANVEGNGKGGNREQEISYISRSLKALAKDLEIPVIALSQLSREVEKRGDRRRPQLSDLRESGSIEQDADMVLFIYRPEYYGLETFEDDKPSAGLAEIMFEKNRHGSNGNVRVRFQAKYTKFSDVEGDFLPSDSDNADVNGGIRPNENFSIIDAAFNNDDEPVQSEPTADDSFPY